jgi:hypothetical protein
LVATRSTEVPKEQFDALRAKVSARLPPAARLYLRASVSARPGERSTGHLFVEGQPVLEVDGVAPELLREVLMAAVSGTALPLRVVLGDEAAAPSDLRIAEIDHD